MAQDSGSSDFVKHTGGCHCGSVRFEVMAPRKLLVFDCNCSVCLKKQNKHFIVPKKQLSIVKGEEDLTCYSFNTHKANHLFCKKCGVQSFYVPRSNQDGYGVAPHCLDEGTVDSIEIKRVDGQNWEKWMEENPEIKEQSKEIALAKSENRMARLLVRLFLLGVLWCFLAVVIVVSRKEYPYNKEPLFYADLFRCDLHQCKDSRRSSSSCLSQARLVLTRLLRQFSLAAAKNNLVYFLYRKSIWAAARYQGHVPYDFPRSIEIAVFQDDVDRLLKIPTEINNTILEFPPLKHHKQYETIPKAKLMDTKSCLLRTETDCQGKKCFNNGLFIDITLLQKNSKGNLLDAYSSSIPWLRHLKGPDYYSKGDIFPLRTLKFDGFVFPVPNLWEKLLSLWYGENWLNTASFPVWYQATYSPVVAVDPVHSCKERTANMLMECL